MKNRSLIFVALISIFVAISCGTISGSSQDSGTPSLRTEDVLLRRIFRRRRPQRRDRLAR